ncbi:hypothetical protein [Pelagibius sp.]|uniref:hypothetical protein n=1 Tax=Pelagibius sp. TaxID=1931238 RepID=UPI002623E4A6|nr:hypothetical protein [Pelagibius sp.]
MKRSGHSTRAAAGLLTLMALVFTAPAGAAAEDPDLLPAPTASYTADTVVTYGGDTLEMKTWHRGSWERQEFAVDDLTQITILRPDRNRAYVTLQQSRQLFEMPYAEAALLPTIGTLRTLETRKLADTEVDGEPVGHFQVVQAEPGEAGGAEADGGAPVMLDLWITADGIVMRAEGEILVDGYREPLQLSRRNLRRQALDPDLFEPTLDLEP